MPIVFTYGATVVNFLHNPQMGDWEHSQVWQSPVIRPGRLPMVRA